MKMTHLVGLTLWLW